VQGDHGQGDVDFWGVYVEASWFLTGEHKNYELGKGRFGRVKPKANFDPADGGWGAWEIAARYSYLDLDDRNIEGGVLWDVTAGLNWYLYPNFRWMLNYVHGDVRQRGVYVFDDDDVLLGRVGISGGADIIQTRFQVDF
jgi:phosphate-selective porin OprO/OprP